MEGSRAAVTARGVIDGEPTALAGLAQLRGPSVLAYCERVAAPGRALQAAADAFSGFRTAAIAAPDPIAINPEALLITHTRFSAAAHAPDPGAGGRGRRKPSMCAEVPRLLAAEAERTLSTGERARLRRHLSRCVSCQEAKSAQLAGERAYRQPSPARLAARDRTTLLEALAGAATINLGAATNGNGSAPADATAVHHVTSAARSSAATPDERSAEASAPEGVPTGPEPDAILGGAVAAAGFAEQETDGAPDEHGLAERAHPDASAHAEEADASVPLAAEAAEHEPLGREDDEYEPPAPRRLRPRRFGDRAVASAPVEPPPEPPAKSGRLRHRRLERREAAEVAASLLAAESLAPEAANAAPAASEPDAAAARAAGPSPSDTQIVSVRSQESPPPRGGMATRILAPAVVLVAGLVVVLALAGVLGSSGGHHSAAASTAAVITPGTFSTAAPAAPTASVQLKLPHGGPMAPALPPGTPFADVQARTVKRSKPTAARRTRASSPTVASTRTSPAAATPAPAATQPAAAPAPTAPSKPQSTARELGSPGTSAPPPQSSTTPTGGGFQPSN